jgi:hypothetical protein
MNLAQKKLGVVSRHHLAFWARDNFDVLHPPGCRCSTIWCTAIRTSLRAAAANCIDCEREAA